VRTLGRLAPECDHGHMAAENPSEVLTILADAQRGFDAAMRGYDRAQVDQFLSTMDDELRAAVAERDALEARTTDLTAQLTSTHAQIESLRRQLRTASESVTAANVDERVATMLADANAEAAKIRAAAEAEAASIRSGATEAALRIRTTAMAEAEQIVVEATQRHAEADETFRRRLSDADWHRGTVEKQLAASLAKTQAEEDRLTAESEANRVRLDAEAQAERERRDAESLAHRAQAEEDFELTLRRRRTAEAVVSAEQKATAEALAARTISDAQQQVTELIDIATGEVRRLNELRNEMQASLKKLYHRLGAVIREVVAETPSLPAE
jgi:cell division septum initiation protein DivIVA